MKYILAYSIILLFFSCRASKETRKTQKLESDTSHVVYSDSTSVQKRGSVNTTENDITEENTVEATLEFEIEDSAGSLKDTVINITGSPSAGWLDIALRKPNLKSIHYKEKNKKQDNSKYTTKTNSVDSTAAKKIDSKAGSKSAVIVNDSIDIKQWSFWGLLPWYVWLIISVIAVGFLWWKLPFLFKRKKIKDENTA